MEFTPGQLKLLAYWGEIQSAVSQRAQTADLWETVRNAATRDGVDLAGVGAIDMGRLRSIAASQRNAMDILSRAAPNAVIDSRMIGVDVTSRSPGDQALAPKWIVRFEHDITVDGQLVTQWRSNTYDGQLPTTHADLRAQVEHDAEAMSEDYGTTHIGIGTISIVAV